MISCIFRLKMNTSCMLPYILILYKIASNWKLRQKIQTQQDAEEELKESHKRIPLNMPVNTS